MPSARSLLRVAFLFAALNMLALPLSPTAAQEQALKDTIYTSPLWGYTIRWHAGAWHVDNDVTSPDVNLLSLSDGHGNFITFTGATDFKGNAKACLDDMRATAFSDPEHTTTSPYTYEASDDPVEWRNKEQSYVLLATTTTADDGTTEEGVVYIECQTLVPGDAVFERFYSGSADAFDQQYAAVADMVESVYLPASAWRPDEDDPTFVSAGYSPLLDLGRNDATLFPLDVDDPRLLIGLVDVAGDKRAIAFENVSDAPVTVDPANLALIYTSLTGEGLDQQHAPYAISWEDGATVNSDGTRTLAPGERATVDVDIAAIDDLLIDCTNLPYLGYEYREPDGASADFANFDPPVCLTGSMAGNDEPEGKPSVTSSPASG